MRLLMFLTLFVWIPILLQNKVAEGCLFLDPCVKVVCPAGTNGRCNWIFPYCQRHVCTPVASCRDEACVAVAEECNRPLCNITTRCNARSRSGRCPDEPHFPSSCTPMCLDDHLCPRNFKCCNGFCVQPIL